MKSNLPPPSSKIISIYSRTYLLDIVLALVPYLDEKRLELLEEKLKQLFSAVMRNYD
jgi:hypothetical protein